MRFSPLLVLLFVACAACSTNTGYHEGRVNLSDYKPVLDLLFTQVGKMEFAFCLDGVELPGGHWTVTRVTLPVQIENDSARVGAFYCAGAPGYIHNHPAGMGGAYLYKSHCGPSPTDLRTLRLFRFAVTWCEPGRFYALSRR